MESVSTDSVKRMREQNIPVIDVLPREYHEKKHIAGTYSVPAQSEHFFEEVERIAGGKEKPVVVYCANEECDASPRAAEALEKNGFKSVMDYDGGVEAWEEAGLEVAGSSV